MAEKKYYDVVSIGTLTYDITQPISDSALKKLNLPKGRSTKICKKTFTPLIKNPKIKQKSAGGVGSNITIGIALNGGKAAMIGRIGMDEIGQEFIKTFKKHKVDFIANPHPEKPSTSLMNYVTPDGERSFAVLLGASSDVGPEDIDENTIKLAKVTHIDSFLLQSPIGIEGMEYAARLARKHDSQVAFSLNDQVMVAKHKAVLRPMLENHADIIIGSIEEFMAAFDLKDENEALKMAKTLNAKVALTQGPNDVFTVEKGKVTRVRVVASSKVVDTCGAGDQFAAGVMKGLADGYSLKDSARQGVRWSKHVIEKLGSLPVKKQRKIRPLDKKPKAPSSKNRITFAA